MRAVKNRDSAAELAVRRLIFGMGYRYRLHRNDLPGKPDIVLSSKRKIVFVHGCFWHGHSCARGARVPKQNRDYWTRKIGRNQERDQRAVVTLEELGWQTIVIWECEIRDRDSLDTKVRQFLQTEPHAS